MLTMNAQGKDFMPYQFTAMLESSQVDVRQVEEYERRDRERKAKTYFSQSGFGKKYADIELSMLSEEQRDVAEKFIGNYEQKGRGGLWLYGTPGTGKTTVSAAICKEFAKRGVSFQYVKAHVMVDSLRNREVHLNARINELKSNAVVVFDEIGRYPEKEWEIYYTFAVIDALYENNVSVILIGNATKEAMAAYLGNAVVNRFKGYTTSYEFKECYRGSENELLVG